MRRPPSLSELQRVSNPANAAPSGPVDLGAQRAPSAPASPGAPAGHGVPSAGEERAPAQSRAARGWQRRRLNATPTPAAEVPPTGPPQVRIRLGRAMRSESGAYYTVLGITLLLVVIGLVMVLSSSSVYSFVRDNGFFGGFVRQTMFAAIGVPLMLICSQVPIEWWKRSAWYLFGLGLALQSLVLVPGVGVEINGNRNWITLFGLQVQPSEFLKLAMLVWLGTVLWRKRTLLHKVVHVYIPAVVGGLIAVCFVMFGSDLGTAAIFVVIIFGALFFAEVRLSFFLVPAVLAIVGALILVQLSPGRVQKFAQVFQTGCTDFEGLCWQPQLGRAAMAEGGLFGVGLGQSKAKWSWLPAADNDYIFAIIGEETGLIGCTIIILLYVALAIALVRVLRSARDLFGVVVTASVLVWIVGQAFANIGVVLGIFPVFGVPLPLLSAGGTALVSTLMAVGVVLSIARDAVDRDEEQAALPGRLRTMGARFKPGKLP